MSNQHATQREYTDSEWNFNANGSIKRSEFLRTLPRDVSFMLTVAKESLRKASILMAQYEAWGDGP